MDTADESSADGNEEGNDEQGDASSADEGGSTSTADVDESGEGQETGPPTCEEEIPPAISVGIELGVRNETGAPIYLHSTFSCVEYLQLFGPTNEEVRRDPPCEQPLCSGLLQDDCSLVCIDGEGDCRERIVRIEPGATFVSNWDGRVWIQRQLPEVCAADCQNDTGCIQRTEASPGTYRIDIRTGDCPNEDPASCECPEGDTTCIINVDREAGFPELTFVNHQFEFPADTTPTLVLR